MKQEEICDGLRSLGARPGMKLFVHSSLSSFGHVEGGPSAVIGALIDVIGSEGTLLLPSFNHGKPFLEGGEGIFDPAVTPTTNGIIPDTFWRMPEVKRSLNPTHSFACRGRDAIRYTKRHHETLTMGEDSPLGLLAREGGYQLNLGTGHGASTAKHLSETMKRVPCLGYRTEEYPVKIPGGPIAKLRTWGWRERDCPLTESGALIEREMENSGVQVTGRIGRCAVAFFKVQELVDAVWRILNRGDGDLPPCSGCSIRPRRIAATVPSDLKD